MDVTSCQAQTLDTTGGKYALKVQLRRTLSDGVVQLKSYKIDVVPGTGGTQVSKVQEIASTNTNAKLQLASQGSTVSAYLLGVAPTTLPEDLKDYQFIKAEKLNTATPPVLVDIVTADPVGTGTQVRVAVVYENPDKSIVPCPSLPLTCQTSSSV